MIVGRKIMIKKIKSFLLLAAVATAFCFSTQNILAQGRGNFDPEQFRQRMLDHLREQMDVKSDDEWKIISDRINKVSDARREVGFGGMRFGGFSRSSRDGGTSTNSPAGDTSSRRSRFGGEPSPEEEALQKAIDDKASAD